MWKIHRRQGFNVIEEQIFSLRPKKDVPTPLEAEEVFVKDGNLENILTNTKKSLSKFQINLKKRCKFFKGRYRNITDFSK